MKSIICTFIFIAIIFYISPYVDYYFTESRSIRDDERSEIFFEEKDYKAPIILKKDLVKSKIDDFLKKEPIFIKHPYSNNKHQLYLRPFNKYFSIPYQHLILIKHIHQPIAKQIYDFVFISFILPDFSVKSPNSIDSLINVTGFEETLNLRIGGTYMKNDEAEQHLDLVNEEGKVILNKKLSNNIIEVYFFSEKNLRTYYFVILNPKKILSPSKQPLLAKCYTGIYLPNTCEVEFYLPFKFKGLDGIRVFYSFNQKYLYLWENIHKKIISSILSYTNSK